MKSMIIMVEKPDLIDEVVEVLQINEIEKISILSSASVNSELKEKEEKKELNFIGSFRKFFDLYYEDEKIIITFVKDEQIEKIRAEIKKMLKNDISNIKIFTFNIDEVLGLK